MRVYYDPAMFAERSIDECTAAILHEDLHVLLRHFERADQYMGVDPTAQQWGWWNEACDLTVNQTLRKAKVPMSEGWLMPEKYGFDENLSVEQYYDLLSKKDEDPPPQQPSDQGQDDQQGDQQDDQGQPDDSPGDDQQQGQQDDPAGGPSGEPYDGDEHPEPGKGSGGSGADGVPRPWECPSPAECNTPGMDDYDQQMIERAVAEEIEKYQREKGEGEVPGYLTRFAEAKLRPKVDPFRALHAAVKYAVTATTGRGDYTWRRLPRRWPPGGLRLPSPIKPVPRATVIVDTSGSMGTRELAQALGVVEQGLRSVPSGGIRVLAGDRCVQSAQKVFRADQVELKGGGGTDMGRLIEQAADERPAPDAVVVITDGWTPWPSSPVRPRVVACLTEEPNSDSYKVPEWITKVVLHDHDA
jgi:predicted metal-dependent peptidase